MGSEERPSRFTLNTSYLLYILTVRMYSCNFKRKNLLKTPPSYSNSGTSLQRPFSDYTEMHTHVFSDSHFQLFPEEDLGVRFGGCRRGGGL